MPFHFSFDDFIDALIINKLVNSISLLMEAPPFGNEQFDE